MKVLPAGSPLPQRILLGILATAGVAHFVVPKGFDDIVPHQLPGSARLWTYVSGVQIPLVWLAVTVMRRAAPRH